MTVEVLDNMLIHDSGNRLTTVTVTEDGGLRLRVKNGVRGAGAVNLDEFNREERIALARHLLQDLSFGANYRLADFTDNIGGPNEREDRRAYVDSFGELWGHTMHATDLQTWIDHQDSSRVDGEWDDRIKTYYKERGY